MSEQNKVYLVIFETRIAGNDARTEVSTIKDPMNSRQVRRDCEDVAIASFFQLAEQAGATWDGKLKCVECVEFKNPGAEH